MLALGAISLVGAPGAGAASKAKEAKVSDGTMTWAVSSYVLTPNPATLSVSEVHHAEAPAAFSDGTGWTFSDGTGTYDTKSGAMLVTFPGALEFGNTSRGNYGFKLANPVFELDADGTGTLTADLSLRPAGATAYNPSTKTVVVDITGAAPSKTKHQVDVTATPTAFSSALIAAAGDLAAHFQATGSSNDANKPPAPIAVEFAYKVKKKG
jgi:hypothetical protein